MEPKVVVSLFNGMSVGRMALDVINCPVARYYSSEIDPAALMVSKALYPDHIEVGDVVRFRKYLVAFDRNPAIADRLINSSFVGADTKTLAKHCLDLLNKPVDLLIGGSPCFVSDTQVLTSVGYKNISDVVVGDLVLSHTGNWRRVLKTGYRDNVYTRVIKGFGNIGIETTDEHPFYVSNMSRRWYNAKRTYVRVFSDPEWVPANSLTRSSYVATVASPEVTTNSYSEIFWYMVGRYTGDGWFRKSRRLHRRDSYVYQFIICCGKAEFNELKDKFDSFGYPYNFSEERTGFKFRICNRDLVDFVSKIGVGSSNKTIHPYLWSESIENKASFIQGLLDSDGCFLKKKAVYKLTTTCKLLALGLQKLVQDVYRVPCRFEFNKKPSTHVIEGRIVNQKDLYVVEFKVDRRKQDKAFNSGIYNWLPVTKNTPTFQLRRVYNLEVDVDNSYTANNIVVHNCQGFSQAGKQLNFNDPRSALFFEFVKIRDLLLSRHPKMFFFLENVKMKKEFIATISEYMGCSPIVLNSALVSAQNRVRLYWTNIPVVGMPEDKGIVLRDILEEDVPEKYFCSTKTLEGFKLRKENNSGGFSHCVFSGNTKTNTLSSRYYKDGKEILLKIDKKGKFKGKSRQGRVFNCRSTLRRKSL